MALRKFDLHGWQHNPFESLRDNCNKSQNVSTLQDIPVLGLLWNIERDTLKIDIRDETLRESVKLIEITAWMIRFCTNRLAKACCVTNVLTIDKLKEAEMKIMLIVQKTSFVYRRVTEIIPGKDGITHLVKVKTTSGEKLRPVQRLYSLEINAVSSEPLRHRVSKGSRKLSQCMGRNLRSKTADSVKSKFNKQPVPNKKTRLR
ncbi:hypothetical protein NPIL_316971 [Nephila pilipes]|uniref:DUF5641 domain-containing protein n=1 Tax=Nephila pilipes TaxID=299642 RepID=A0A8X6ILF3_NEPPI|nr:hypothetical protein NPIL_316971 [Nephila pilipes]